MKRMVGFALIIIGIIVLGTGIYFVANDSKGHVPEDVAVEIPPVERMIEDTVQPEQIKTSSNDGGIEDREKSYELGLEFEKYVVKKFDSKRFIIKNWAGDKYVEGRYAETTLHPDLTMELKMGKDRYSFAVECKWRSTPTSNFLRFATDAQLLRYQKFSDEKDIPTFIVLGVGGEPAAPEQVFVIPVNRFSKANQHLDNLRDLQKKNDSLFFFDFNKKELK